MANIYKLTKPLSQLYSDCYEGAGRSTSFNLRSANVKSAIPKSWPGSKLGDHSSATGHTELLKVHTRDVLVVDVKSTHSHSFFFFNSFSIWLKGP